MRNNNKDRFWKIFDDSDFVFWDFDGVIKDSVAVKGSSYYELFLPFGKSCAESVRKHHQENGGISRYEKIPLYLSWIDESRRSGITSSELLSKFSQLVVDRVIESDWILGARECLVSYASSKTFILTSATPEEELASIVETLKINHCFYKIFGAPKSKRSAIAETVEELSIPFDRALMIGDAATDYQAARACNVNFVLRSAAINPFDSVGLDRDAVVIPDFKK